MAAVLRAFPLLDHLSTAMLSASYCTNIPEELFALFICPCTPRGVIKG